MTTLGFPLDSAIVGYHDDGFPAYSNEYSSEDYREVISKLVSNGVVAFSGGNSLQGATLTSTTKNNTGEIHIEKGAAVINGAFFINKSTKKFYITAPTLQGSEKTKTKYTFVFVRLVKNSDGEDLDFYLQENFTAVVPTVNNSLLLGRVESSTYDTNGELSYHHGYNDRRASEYCGFSVPFAEVDTSAYYDAVQQVVNESKAEVEATIPTLLENAQESVDSAISNLEEQTQTAVDLAQAAIDETLYAQLDTKIDSIEDKAPAYLKPTIEIPNGADLNDYKEPGAYFCRAENVESIKNKSTQAIGEPFILYVYENDFLDDDDATQSVVQHYMAGYTVSVWRRLSFVNGSLSSATAWIRDLRNKVDTNDINNNAVTTAKIADGAVTQDKLADDINLGNNIEEKAPMYLQPAIEIPANADLKNYIEPGSYFCKKENASTLKNAPIASLSETLFLYVSRGENFSNQTSGFSVIQRIEVGFSNYMIIRQYNESGEYVTSYNGWTKNLQGSVGGSEIQNGAITTPKLADNSVTEEKLADELKPSDIGWINDISSQEGVFRHRVKNGFLTVVLSRSTELDVSNGYVDLFTLPEDSRPTINTYANASIVSGSSVISSIINIGTNGLVRFLNPGAVGTKLIYCCVTVPI